MDVLLNRNMHSTRTLPWTCLDTPEPIVQITTEQQSKTIIVPEMPRIDLVVLAPVKSNLLLSPAIVVLTVKSILPTRTPS